MRIIIAADLVPTQTNESYFVQGDADHLFGRELLDYLSTADIFCFNLETPLTDHRETVYYPGPHLCAKPETIHGIARIKPTVISIGNNHALDQGAEGLKETIRTLREAEIPFIGAGANSDEARKPYFYKKEGLRIGIYNCAEYGCSAASKTAYGANHYDPLTTFEDVRELKQNCDYAIILYHGGKEFYRYPSPQLQRICRKFVDVGADLIICQHTHCVGCEERYNNGVIVYGQGNFLFDRNEDEFKKNAILVECNIEAAQAPEIRYVPIVKHGECVRKASSDEESDILTGFSNRSEEILSPGFVDSEYNKLATEYYEKYVNKITGNRRFMKLLNKLSGGHFFQKYYNRRSALAVLNVIATENHDELFKAGLRLPH